MVLRDVRQRIYAMAVILAISTGGAASAKGVTLVQQSDGSVQTYLDVMISVTGQKLRLETADQKGVLEIKNGACSFVGEIQRCLPYAVTLTQHGKSRPILLTHGTVFLNLTNDAQTLPHSSEELAPRTVLALLHTQHGTYITVKGRIDKVGS